MSGLLIVSQLKVANSGIQCSQFARTIQLVTIGNLLKAQALSIIAIQSLLKVAVLEINNCFRILVVCLKGFGFENVVIESDNSQNNNYNCCNCPCEHVRVVLNPLTGSGQSFVYILKLLVLFLKVFLCHKCMFN